jgi:hypothetical protein
MDAHTTFSTREVNNSPTVSQWIFFVQVCVAQVRYTAGLYTASAFNM